METIGKNSTGSEDFENSNEKMTGKDSTTPAFSRTQALEMVKRAIEDSLKTPGERYLEALNRDAMIAAVRKHKEQRS